MKSALIRNIATCRMSHSNEVFFVAALLPEEASLDRGVAVGRGQ